MIIKKVKLMKNGCLEVTYTDNEGNDINLKGANTAHPDMKNAIKRLVPFFCELTEQKESEKINWDDIECDANIELLRRLDVHGVTISGSDAFVSVTITGNRTLNVTNRILNLNTPNVNLDAETETYDRVIGLQECVDMICEEAKLYITEHKYQVVQTTFDFEGSEDPFGADGAAGESGNLEENAV